MRLEDIYPAVLTIILIGIVLGIGIYIMVEVESEMYTATTGTATNVTTSGVVNETGTYPTGITPTIYRDCSLTVTEMSNETEYAVIGAGNYTVAGCLITCSGCEVGLNNTAWNVTGTYSYSADSEASNALNETVGGIGDFAGWIAIIVVVMAAAIVLGIVLSSFGRKTPGV